MAQLSLFNGVALGLLLNVTVVLPRFHTFFNERGEQRRLVGVGVRGRGRGRGRVRGRVRV